MQWPVIHLYDRQTANSLQSLSQLQDVLIWEYAKANDFGIVSKDSDFHQRSLLYGVIHKRSQIVKKDASNR
jgi:predicted nuclease of predicted toxin-antitoxin system